MRAVVALSIVFLTSGSMQALASDPPAQPQQPSVPGQQTNATAPAPQSPTPAATTPAKSGKPSDLTADEKRLVSQGYKVQMRGDEKYFCRREIPLGSHFETKVCMTAAQIAAIAQESKDVTEEAQRHMVNPRGN